MGKIIRLSSLFASLFVLTACPDDRYCPVYTLAQEDFLVNLPGNIDTLSQGDIIWFSGGRALPNLENRKTIEKELPYAPTIRLEFYQIANNLPFDSLIRPVPYLPYTFTTVRPFVLHSQVGRSTYTNHTEAAINGELTKDSVFMNWGLEAKKPGLYCIKIDKNGLSDVLLDHRTEDCPISWRYMFLYTGNQSFSPYLTLFPHLNELDSRLNFLVYVR